MLLDLHKIITANDNMCYEFVKASMVNTYCLCWMGSGGGIEFVPSCMHIFWSYCLLKVIGHAFMGVNVIMLPLQIKISDYALKSCILIN